MQGPVIYARPGSGRQMSEHRDYAAGMDANAVTRWIDDNAHPLTSLNPRTRLADLETLAQLVRDATVVGLGASTRGAHELSTLMHRVLRFLVEDVGFRSLAVEDDWTTGVQINKYLRTGDGDPRALVADAWLPFRTEEFLDVILWMRSYNERHPADPVRFVGVDINRVRSFAYDAVADYVRQAAPDRLDELEAHYAALRPAAGIDEHTEWYRSQPDKQPFIDHARRAHDLVDGLGASEGHALALHHARVASTSITRPTASPSPSSASPRTPSGGRTTLATGPSTGAEADTRPMPGHASSPRR